MTDLQERLSADTMFFLIGIFMIEYNYTEENVLNMKNKVSECFSYFLSFPAVTVIQNVSYD